MHESDKKPKAYYCLVQGEQLGPVSGSQLKEMAKSGKLLATDLVWESNKAKRYVAGTIPELFPSTEEACAKDTGEARAHAEEQNPLVHSSSCDACPLLRITDVRSLFRRGPAGLFSRYQMLIVTADFMVGIKWRTYPNISDHHVTIDGIDSLNPPFGESFRISLSDIQEVTFQGYVRRTFLSRLVLDDLVLMRVKSASGYDTLWVYRRDVPRIRERLMSACKPRILAKWKQRGTGFLAGIAIGYLIGSVIIADEGGRAVLRSQFESMGGDIASLYHNFTMFVAVLTGLLFQWYTTSDVSDEIPESGFHALDARVWASDANQLRTKNPIRSNLLGFGLRLIGIFWLLAVYRLAVTAYSSTSNMEDGFARGSLIGGFISIASLPAFAILYTGLSIMKPRLRTPEDQKDSVSILFLRTFALDGMTTLQPSSTLSSYLGVSGTGSLKAWFQQGFGYFDLKLWQCVHLLRLIRLALGIVGDTTEQALVRYFSMFGVVCAIGRPGERVAEIGAVRQYVADEHWQDLVLQHLNCCKAIIIQPSDTLGMAWELEQVLRLVDRTKVLIVLGNNPGSASDFEALQEMFSKHSASLPASLPFQNAPVFLWFGRDGSTHWTKISYYSPMKWLFLGSAVDLGHTLKQFSARLENRFEPQPARREFPSYHQLIAWGLALSWVFLLTFCLDTRNVVAIARGASSLNFDKTKLVAKAQGNHSVKQYVGSALPYSIEVPESWSLSQRQPDGPEYTFSIPNISLLTITAQKVNEDGWNDVQRFKDIVWEIDKRKHYGEKVESIKVLKSESRVIGDRTCFQVQLNVRLTTGKRFFVHQLAYSGEDGTLLIYLETAANSSSETQQDAQAILSSLAFSGRIDQSVSMKEYHSPDEFYSFTIPAAWVQSGQPTAGADFEFTYLNAFGQLLIRRVDHKHRRNFSEESFAKEYGQMLEEQLSIGKFSSLKVKLVRKEQQNDGDHPSLLYTYSFELDGKLTHHHWVRVYHSLDRILLVGITLPKADFYWSVAHKTLAGFRINQSPETKLIESSRASSNR